MKRLSRAAGAAVALAGGAASVSFALAGSASAAQSTMPLSCDGAQLFLRTNNNNSGDNGGWSVAQITDKSGHLIPTSFNYSLVDTTNPFTFSQTSAKGQGNANANQTQVSCQADYASTLGAEAPPSFDYAGTGTQPTDQVTVTITVTAVPKIKG
jgi:hypothetical protein